MALAFRILIVSAVAALMVAFLLPLGHPLHFHVSLDAPTPAAILIAPALLLVGFATLVSAAGLLLFRRWGPWLGVVVLACWLAAFSLAFVTGVGAALSLSAKWLFALFAMAWLSGLLACRHPSVVMRFSARTDHSSKRTR